ncbi:MAG TPA: hypothetical protein VMV79_07745 [Alphaproteobacteria bacterium]|nr:hypothetical protein [Alphaproteobacteria bacterium]
MENTRSSFAKIVNPDLARAALRGVESFGEFRIIVRLAQPERTPPYMTVTGVHSPGHMKARIPCDQIARLDKDTNVLSVELREHVSRRSVN